LLLAQSLLLVVAEEAGAPLENQVLLHWPRQLRAAAERLAPARYKRQQFVWDKDKRVRDNNTKSGRQPTTNRAVPRRRRETNIRVANWRRKQGRRALVRAKRARLMK